MTDRSHERRLHCDTEHTPLDVDIENTRERTPELMVDPQRRTRVKICCIQTPDDARIAIAHGVDALGLVSAMPSGPGVASDDALRTLAIASPPGVSRFLLTAHTDVDTLIQQQRSIGADTLQLVNHPLPPEQYHRMRRALPGIRWVQVIHVENEASLQQALTVARHVDALLLDSGRPNAEVPELGGTGRVHDWSLSARIVDQCQRRGQTPVFLAGGLNPENVAQAIETVRPYGVDVCSGLRRDQRLDAELVQRFMASVSRARNA